MSEFVELGKVVKSLTKSVRSTTVANYVLAKAIKVIATLPTTDIVRCKDCKYWEVDNDVGFCVRTEECDWNADDFCSKGEKR